MADTALTQFVAGMAAGTIRTIDLTQSLSEDTPVLVLPEPFGQTASFSRQEISAYDERGVAWHWNNFTTGEHTGTHFDAPVHWVTGQDLPENTVDTIPVSRFAGQAVVINASRESASSEERRVGKRWGNA